MKPLLIAIVILALTACKKETLKPLEPQMMYQDLQNAEIKYNTFKRLDLDGNGTTDVRFGTYHIGDPLTQMDKIQFHAASMIESNFPIDQHDNAPVFSKGTIIKTNNTADYEWFRVSLVVLAQKNIPVTGTIHWTGNWKDVSRQYLPIQLLKGNQRYNGWIELSFDMENEKIILHKAAISNTPDVDIVAGN